MCSCAKWLEIIAAIIVFVLALWPAWLGAATKWILVIVALALLLHALFCKCCMCESNPVISETVKKKK
jgi:hypothetical protein